MTLLSCAMCNEDSADRFLVEEEARNWVVPTLPKAPAQFPDTCVGVSAYPLVAKAAGEVHLSSPLCLCQRRHSTGSQQRDSRSPTRVQ